MKYIVSCFIALIGLTIWLLFTLIMTCTIVGLAITLDEEYLAIPKKLLKVFENENK